MCVLCERLAAHAAHPRLFPQVYQLMPLQVAHLVELLPTGGADMLLVGMEHLVFLQAPKMAEGLAADLAHVGFVGGVDELVLAKLAGQDEPLVAKLADMVLLTGVELHVVVQTGAGPHQLSAQMAHV